MTVVCHIIAGLRAGGAERMLSRIATHAQPGVTHVVVSLLDEGAYGEFFKAAGIELHCLRMRRKVPSPRAFFELTRLLRERRPDVVMTWLYPADLIGTACAVAAGLGFSRIVWNLRCSNIELSKNAVLDGLVIKSLARLSPRPYAVAVNSESGRLHHAALGYRPRNWVYLPNGVEVDVWRPCAQTRQDMRQELGVGADEVLCGMVARVDPQKDYPNFLAAAEQVSAKRRDVRFLLIGDGTRDLVIPASLEGRVIALGNQKNVPALMTALDVNVLSSAYGEGFPNVICEAMATEVPCVVTDVGDAKRLVEGVGISVPPRDSGALAQAILQLVEMPTEERIELGRAARRRVVENYDLQTVCSAYSRLWGAMADRAGDRG